MTDRRSLWLVTVASDVSSRDGIGWEFADLHQRASGPSFAKMAATERFSLPRVAMERCRRSGSLWR